MKNLIIGHCNNIIHDRIVTDKTAIVMIIIDSADITETCL